MKNKLICLVGLPGAGKTEVAEYLKSKRNFEFLRFGQLTLDKVIESGQEPTEALERKFREQIRAEYGMGAFATLNIPKFEVLLQKGDTIGDGLYSWEEYLILKEKYADNLVIVAVYAPPVVRYERLEHRSDHHGNDPKKFFRSFAKDEARSRDKAQIENLHQAGPIAMADFTIINTDDIVYLHTQIDKIYKEIYGK